MTKLYANKDSLANTAFCIIAISWKSNCFGTTIIITDSFTIQLKSPHLVRTVTYVQTYDHVMPPYTISNYPPLVCEAERRLSRSKWWMQVWGVQSGPLWMLYDCNCSHKIIINFIASVCKYLTYDLLEWTRYMTIWCPLLVHNIKLSAPCVRRQRGGCHTVNDGWKSAVCKAGQ